MPWTEKSAIRLAVFVASLRQLPHARMLFLSSASRDDHNVGEAALRPAERLLALA